MFRRLQNHPAFVFAWAFIFVIALAVVASSAPPIMITDSGYYVTIFDDSGFPEWVIADQVIDVRTGAPDDNPDKPTPDVEPPPEGISRDVSDWAAAVGDGTGAQKYALVLETVRDGVNDGSIPLDQVFRVLRESAEKVLSDDWKDFRLKLGEYFTTASQNGDFSDQGKAAGTIELVRYGVAYASRSSEAISMADSVAVVSTVNSIIKGAN